MAIELVATRTGSVNRNAKQFVAARTGGVNRNDLQNYQLRAVAAHTGSVNRNIELYAAISGRLPSLPTRVA